MKDERNHNAQNGQGRDEQKHQPGQEQDKQRHGQGQDQQRQGQDQKQARDKQHQGQENRTNGNKENTTEGKTRRNLAQIIMKNKETDLAKEDK